MCLRTLSKILPPPPLSRNETSPDHSGMSKQVRNRSELINLGTRESPLLLLLCPACSTLEDILTFHFHFSPGKMNFDYLFVLPVPWRESFWSSRAQTAVPRNGETAGRASPYSQPISHSTFFTQYHGCFIT